MNDSVSFLHTFSIVHVLFLVFLRASFTIESTSLEHLTINIPTKKNKNHFPSQSDHHTDTKVRPTRCACTSFGRLGCVFRYSILQVPCSRSDVSLSRSARSVCAFVTAASPHKTDRFPRVSALPSVQAPTPQFYRTTSRKPFSGIGLNRTKNRHPRVFVCSAIQQHNNSTTTEPPCRRIVHRNPDSPPKLSER